MWRYEKRLQHPVNITTPNPQLAQFIASQYGGPDGEIAASMRYLSQRYAMPYDIGKAVLTDVGTEELAHMEMIAAIIHQLTKGLTAEQIAASGLGPYYIDHTNGIWPQAAGGVPDPEVCDPIRFLREREIVHFQRFGEALRSVQDHLDSRNFYALNPAFDNPALTDTGTAACA